MTQLTRQQCERVKESLLLLQGMAELQRKAWIDRRLADDPAVRSEVLSLLGHAGNAEDERLAPVIPTPGSSSEAPAHPGRIGPYIIERLIGQGGLALVYRARQEDPVQRTIALKVLRGGVVGSELLRRFELERDVIAGLQHRNICRLLDAGSDNDGHPYLAMELVEGPPITEYVQLHNLALSDRIGLMIQVCRGVQHAHNRGVIHRDLKPTNVLVADEDTEPVAKIIDFGIAKMLAGEPSPHPTTISGQVVGTIGYMSPEQADPRGGVPDVRSDVYSLGVLLYELIAGVRPHPDAAFEARSFAEIHSYLLARRPDSPSKATGLAGHIATRSDGFAAELDCITLKALEPDPASRYMSPSLLADDLERYLRGEPISARPPTTVYLTRMFVRRHRIALGFTGALIAILLAGLTFTALGFRSALREAQRAEAALLAEEIARSESDQVATFLQELLMRVRPSELGQNASFREILGAAAADVEAEPPQATRVRASIAFALAEPIYLLGDFEAAGRLLTPVVDLLEQLPESDRRRSDLELLAKSSLRLGYVASRRSERIEAEERFEAAAMYAELAGDQRTAYAGTGAVAQSLAARGEYDLAITMFKELLATDLALSDQMLRASTLSNLGVALGRAGRAAEGLAASREGYSIRRAALPNDPTTYQIGWQLGIAMLEAGDPREAVEHLDANTEAAAEALGTTHPDVLNGVITTEYARARTGAARDDPALAQSILKRMQTAIDQMRETTAIPPTQIAFGMGYLVGATLQTGDAAGAAKLASEVIQSEIDRVGENDIGVVQLRLQIGSMLSAGGEVEAALPILRGAYDSALPGTRGATMAPRLALEIAAAYQRLGRAEEAELWRSRAR